MSWNNIHGHDLIVEQFRRALKCGRLASSFLFIGPSGIGKRTFARRLAQALLCEENSEQELNACGSCPSCQQVMADSHPDLLQVFKPAGKSFIPLETFIGDGEHRMREGLCHDIALKPFRGGRKIAVIDDADYLNREGANCLLKTLEEPPPKSVLILIATSEQTQLPTIRSRCQIVRFHPLHDNLVAKLLVEHGEIEDLEEASRLAVLSQGSLQRAMQLSDPSLREFRLQLLIRLSRADEGLFDFVDELSAFVDDAGKEAQPRRARMRLVFEIAGEFYRHLMRTIGGAAPAADEDLLRAISNALKSWPGDEQAAADCLQRCFDARAQVDANANQATLLECWLDDLAEIARTGRALVH